MEPYYPLQVFVCDQCFFVQLEEFENPEEIFSDYPTKVYEVDIDRTVAAFDSALAVYRRMLDEGVERYLVGGPTKSVYRRTIRLDGSRKNRKLSEERAHAHR